MITCRILGGDDVGIWRPLRQAALREYPLAFLTSLEDELARSDSDVVAQLTQGNSHAVFLNESPIGIAAMVRLTPSRARHRGEIAAFYVDPTAHGSGAAQALMDHLARQAEAQGIWQLELFVAQSNPRARAFYERNGFQVCGTVPNAIVGPGGPETDDVMVRLLSGAPEGAGLA